MTVHPQPGAAPSGSPPDPDGPDATRERERWTASADAWDRWADPMADLADKLNRPLLDAVGLVEGERLLDLASGAGEPALSAARRAGPAGLVVGSDLVPGMMTGAIRRVRGTDGPAPSFAAADMTALPFADAAFDRVTCRFGIMFVPPVEAALREVRRVLRPGGKAAFMVWGPRSGNGLFAEIGAVVAGHLGEDGSLDPLFRFAGPGRLSALLQAAGFTSTAESDLTPVRKAPADQPFWRAALEMSFGHRLDGLPPDRRAAIEADIARRFAAQAVDGIVPVPSHARIVVGG
ncbi:class I SAM-dependent methyltransferase [Azospirillum picis]|uniref:SAM-dependent methyltransferase n=1 Tax=Azospirillum picis TaxID=488438 RepID=A0ABU0MTP2_9PROT|nr:methyltransferase domain-containing protein [Azospirillum picis]MBP2303109.1 SAM-dependent methyltransferase [Azospirillum picis]MDQ0536861.1 SAM-dependent methyltransferase [Azospirillum picis]